MGLRELAGDMARNTSGLWRGIADAVDPEGRRPAGRPAPEPTTSTPPTAPSSESDAGSDSVDRLGEHDGTMIVPLDTWTRILEQIGHVHEAGQQLAEARERAARAETENRFLREQVKELKTSRRVVRRPGAKPEAPAAVGDRPARGSAPSEAVRESRVVRARRQASAWLNP
jgi:hypothetical protein